MFKIVMRFFMVVLISITSNFYMQGATILQQSIFDFIQNPGSFMILTQLFSETQTDASVNKLLDSRTLFAPNDNAFKQFSRLGLLDGASNTENRKKFANFFVVAKKLSPQEVSQPGAKFTTVAGTQINTDQLGKILYSKTVKNGIIYVIDTVPVNPDVQKIIFPEKK